MLENLFLGFWNKLLYLISSVKMVQYRSYSSLTSGELWPLGTTCLRRNDMTSSSSPESSLPPSQDLPLSTSLFCDDVGESSRMTSWTRLQKSNHSFHAQSQLVTNHVQNGVNNLFEIFGFFDLTFHDVMKILLVFCRYKFWELEH